MKCKEYKIKSIKSIGKKRVINLTVKKNHTFITDNGIAVGNCDGLSDQALKSLKVFIESTYKICRFIFITNHVSKIPSTLMSRLQHFSFGETPAEKQELQKGMLKRSFLILKEEGVEFDRDIVKQLVQDLYPDFRHIIHSLQQAYKANGCIDERALGFMDQVILHGLVNELKAKKFENVRKLAVGIDPSSFFSSFYDEINNLIENSSKADIISILGEYAFRDGISVNREISLVCCLIEIMKTAKWIK